MSHPSNGCCCATSSGHYCKRTILIVLLHIIVIVLKCILLKCRVCSSLLLCFFIVIFVRWGIPAPSLINFGLDQNGFVASHSHKGQNPNHGHDDEQDGHTCAHQPCSSHPQVTPLTHVPEVVSYEAAKAQTRPIIQRPFVGGHKNIVHGHRCVILPANRKVAWVVCADAVMVAVVRMAERGAAVV